MRGQSDLVKKPLLKRIKTWAVVLIVVLIYAWAFGSAPHLELKDTAAQALKAIILSAATFNVGCMASGSDGAT
ncbi:hypothetical protein FO478_11905, partial [Heyndrickxia coagulans DSM 1 = ATCC 7050]|nr:hypothetical protein [Heyndrickxia coagulans DSM 1 = ATCC 7050]